MGDRPLTSEYLLKGINFLGINITRPVVFGEIQTREATIIRLHSKVRGHSHPTAYNQGSEEVVL